MEISPSIIAADQARLADAVATIESAGADAVHVDVMDGRFVPNITIGPQVARDVGRACSLPLDCHLMVADPAAWVQPFLDAGAFRISIHLEACVHLHRAVTAIRDGGAQAAVAINPSTPVEALSEILPHVDGVLVMSVNPGFAGQRFIEASVAKVRRVAALVAERGSEAKIQVDGGVTPANAGRLAAAGAVRLVAGSAVFRADDPAAAISALRAAASSAV